MGFIPATFQGFYKTLTDSELDKADSDTDDDIPLSHFVKEGPSSRSEVNLAENGGAQEPTRAQKKS